MEKNSACKLGELVANTVEPLLSRLGYSIRDLKGFEIDPDGPRIIIELEGEGFSSIIDFSPDGCEHQVIMPIGPGLSEERVEEAIAEAIEEGEEFTGVEEYDVVYDGDEGVLSVTLFTATVSSQPRLQDLLKTVRKTVESLKEPADS